MELHQKYAPILRFNRNERFYPMRVDDMLRYSSLYRKGETNPLLTRGQVTPDSLVKHGSTRTSFLRSVTSGPLTSDEVVSAWGEGALELVYRWATLNPAKLTDTLARKVYSWFSPKTSRAAHLFWWNNLVTHWLEDESDSKSSKGLPRLLLPQATQESAIEAYGQSRAPYTYYYRQIKEGGYLCLQYWFFYSYNNWGSAFGGMNDHEGDWEGMTLFFRLDGSGRPQEPPAYITYADHESCQTKPWGHPDVTFVGNHPVGYAAAGSHATYPEAKTQPLMALYSLYDYATGDGITIDHDQWAHSIDLDDVAWLGQYQGSWGTRFWMPLMQAKSRLTKLLLSHPVAALLREKLPDEIELPGVSAPFGPVDAHRPQYAAPTSWAGVPAAEK